MDVFYAGDLYRENESSDAYTSDFVVRDGMDTNASHGLEQLGLYGLTPCSCGSAKEEH